MKRITRKVLANPKMRQLTKEAGSLFNNSIREKNRQSAIEGMRRQATLNNVDKQQVARDDHIVNLFKGHFNQIKLGYKSYQTKDWMQNLLLATVEWLIKNYGAKETYSILQSLADYAASRIIEKVRANK